MCLSSASRLSPLPHAMTVDPITLQVIQARLAGIVQEMQNSLFRTGYSTIIRESQDASCAILNTRGEVIAQHVVLPLHMGAFPACAAAILKTFSARRNSTTATPSSPTIPISAAAPTRPTWACSRRFFFDGEWVGFAANMAHKSDIGGTVPGSGSRHRAGNLSGRLASAAGKIHGARSSRSKRSKR